MDQKLIERVKVVHELSTIFIPKFKGMGWDNITNLFIKAELMSQVLKLFSNVLDSKYPTATSLEHYYICERIWQDVLEAAHKDMNDRNSTHIDNLAQNVQKVTLKSHENTGIYVNQNNIAEKANQIIQEFLKDKDGSFVPSPENSDL